MTTPTTPTPMTYSSLSQHSKTGAYIARTTFKSTDFESLKTWRRENIDRLAAKGANRVLFSGRKVFRVYKPAEYYRDDLYTFEVWYAIQDQTAAEQMYRDVLNGTFADNADKYRETLKSLVFG